MCVSYTSCCISPHPSISFTSHPYLSPCRVVWVVCCVACACVCSFSVMHHVNALVKDVGNTAIHHHCLVLFGARSDVYGATCGCVECCVFFFLHHPLSLLQPCDVSCVWFEAVFVCLCVCLCWLCASVLRFSFP